MVFVGRQILAGAFFPRVPGEWAMRPCMMLTREWTAAGTCADRLQVGGPHPRGGVRVVAARWPGRTGPDRWAHWATVGSGRGRRRAFARVGGAHRGDGSISVHAPVRPTRRGILVSPPAGQFGPVVAPRQRQTGVVGGSGSLGSPISPGSPVADVVPFPWCQREDQGFQASVPTRRASRRPVAAHHRTSTDAGRPDLPLRP